MRHALLCLACVLVLSPATRSDPAAVWCPNPLTEILEGADYSDKNDPEAAIRIVGTRNGAFSGQAVVYFKTPAKGPDASVSDLILRGGAATIPAAAIEVRYAIPRGLGESSKPSPFDALTETPRPDGTTHPVWITVNVPQDAPPGEYEGTVSVAGRSIPVRLTVCDWTLPAPADFITFVDFIQSAESVAVQYNVPLWSDRHVELVGASFRQLAKVGNKTIYLHLAGRSNFGNSETIVRWTKEGDGFKHDFSPVEQYLDAALKNGIKPAVIVMYDWEPYVGGGHKHSDAPRTLGNYFTVYDPKTGTVSEAEGPIHGGPSPGYPNYPADYIAFWKPVYDGIYRVLKDRNLAGAVICHGLFKDGAQPNESTVKTLKQITLWAVWADQNHGSPSSIHGEPVGYDTTVWNAQMPVDPAQKRTYGWQRTRIVAMFDRDMGQAIFAGQIVRSRLLGELNISGNQRGFGRMAADFWPVLKDGRGRVSSLAARYPESSWAQLNLRATSYLSPGPNGAGTTIRFEMLREGIQECEARIFIEKALLAKKLPEPLAAKCQEILDERVRAIITGLGPGIKRPRQTEVGTVAAFVASNWQERSRMLYAAAAEVAEALGR